MPDHALDFRAETRSSDDTVELASGLSGPPRRRAADRVAGGDIGALMRFQEEQLAREWADIERASAALRLGEPALQSVNQPRNVAAPKTRPLWLMIGVLWISTALFAVGTVAAIARLAG